MGLRDLQIIFFAQFTNFCGIGVVDELSIGIPQMSSKSLMHNQVLIFSDSEHMLPP